MSVISETDIAKTGQLAAQFVVKFHGDADAPDTLVLSRNDYEDFFYKHPAMASLLEGLLLNQTFLFVGYSLNDPNFDRSIARSPECSRRPQRHAFATTLDDAASGLTSEIWESKNLHVLPMPGETVREKSQALTRFLDDLTTQTALNEPKAFLAPGQTGTSAPMADLRKTLKALGNQVEEASSGPLTSETAMELASTLRFLTRHGWRPSIQETAWETWQRLADAMGDDLEQKRAMLREALKQTEKLTDADAIRAELLNS